MNEKVIKRDDLLRILKEQKANLKAAYGVTDIGVFGSLARGEETPDSDIDIMVKMQPDLIKRACLKEELESILGKKVDVVRYRMSMNKSLKRRIDNEGFYV